MANIKSAKKRITVSNTKKLQNQMVRSQMKTAIKKLTVAVAENNLELAKSLLPLASSQIDNAAKKNVIHKNAANRKKAQIAKAVFQLEHGVQNKTEEVAATKAVKEVKAEEVKVEEVKPVEKKTRTRKTTKKATEESK